MEMELPSVHADGDHRRFRDYLLALEEERRKIHVFQRELPLCLDLVTHTIEGIRSQMDSAAVATEEETETVTHHDHGDQPVLEEFIPLKPCLSSCSHNAANKEEDPETRPTTPETSSSKSMMPDWLQSVQLWSQQSSLNKDLPCKPVALNARGGAFHPFEKKNSRAEAEVPAASSTTAPASSAVVGDSGHKATSNAAEVPASSTTAPASSAVVGDSGDKAATSNTAEVVHKDSTGKRDANDTDKDKEDKEEGQSPQHNRKPRRCWAPELHRLFLQALQQLGGPQVATPKQIRELMKVDGLTNDEVKSHLQKYRLHTSRRPASSTAQSSAAATLQATPQFLVVGSCFWVSQQEYAAAAQAQAQPQVKGSASQVYAPVATLPSGLQQQRSEKQSSSRQPEGRRSSGGNTGDASSDSPAVSSSSSQTFSA